ncbi:hypothetical protein [Burkholderia gladioli]|uniref:hypothetical protein n=1 Tax=Burkholderia gladioli TaxID=28095 RepID=UPI003D36222D
MKPLRIARLSIRTAAEIYWEVRRFTLDEQIEIDGRDDISLDLLLRLERASMSAAPF